MTDIVCVICNRNILPAPVAERARLWLLVDGPAIRLPMDLRLTARHVDGVVSLVLANDSGEQLSMAIDVPCGVRGSFTATPRAIARRADADVAVLVEFHTPGATPQTFIWSLVA